jgi:AAHS family 3-hydroxyphenylpropionic acid transporter
MNGTSEATKSFYNALIGSSGILGTTAGAISASQFMKIGRRNAFLIATVIAFAGTFLQMFNSFPFFLIGRTIYGLGVGVLSIVGPRFIEETVPDRLISTYNPLFMCSVALGGMMSLLLAVGLPSDQDISHLIKTKYWRVIIGAPLPL